MNGDVVFPSNHNPGPPEPPVPSPAPGGQFAPPIKEKKGKSGKVWMIIALVMTLVAAGLGWLWYDEKNKPAEVADTNTSENQDGDLAVNAPVSYTAEVGKFELTLPTGYAIIETADGGAEGGPVTSITVAKFEENSSSIINQSREFRIIAIPRPGQTLADNDRVNALKSESATKKADISIAQTPAVWYEVPGIGPFSSVVFIKGDIIYQISFDADSLDDETYKAVAEGFKFSE